MKKLLMFIFLCSLPIKLMAATLKELLIEAQLNPSTPQTSLLEGHLVNELLAKNPTGKIWGKAWRIKPLAEPGCGRYALRLSMAKENTQVTLGEVEIDLCEGGLPPAPLSLNEAK